MKILLILMVSYFTSASMFPALENSGDKSTPIRSIIHPSDPTTSTVSEADFYSIINNSFSLYSHLQGNDGKDIEIGIQEWETPYLSAWAHDNGKTLTVNYWGGYARVNGTTKLSFALTACHEIGHVVGREPTHRPSTMQPMMSAEGQADYFAASECLKNYLINFPIDREIKLSPLLASLCHERFKDLADTQTNTELCMKVMQAGMDISVIFAHLLRAEVPDPLKPSTLVVDETLYDAYPSIQCRLDTYIQGALSQYPLELEKSEKRPACWFKTL
ncbi:MAG: hypothetical protein CME69_04860 [Halobacteriovorax sp.]|nr:hypothetical protein [Halobacteriovorax sp.]